MNNQLKSVYIFGGLQSQSLACHEIAIYLKEKHFANEFSMCYSEKDANFENYLKEQNEIEYKYLDKLDSLEAIALNEKCSNEQIIKWEQRLGESLLDIIVADRQIGNVYVADANIPKTNLILSMNHEKMKNLVCYFLDFFEKRLLNSKPDFIFITCIASSEPLALVKVCKYLKIPFFVANSSRILNRTIIVENNIKEQSLRLDKKFKELCLKKEKVVLKKEFLDYKKTFETNEMEITPWAEMQNNNIVKIRNKFLINILISSSWDLFKRFVVSFKRKKVYVRKKLYFSDWSIKVKEILYIKYCLNKTFSDINTDDKFVYFPLHVDPEASTMVYAPNFTNQLQLLEILAKNIPLSHKLYVKEHPYMVGKRQSFFYKKLKQFKNIVLISPYADSNYLSTNADLITTITGTTGWEGIMKKKEVLTFGKCFYTELGFSTPCNNLNNLSPLIHKLIYFPDKTKFENLDFYLKASEEDSFDFDLYEWEATSITPGNIPNSLKNGLRLMTDALIRSIKEYNANT